MKNLELIQFLNWLIKNYTTEPTSDPNTMYYCNAEGERVSIDYIIEHFKIDAEEI